MRSAHGARRLSKSRPEDGARPGRLARIAACGMVAVGCALAAPGSPAPGGYGGGRDGAARSRDAAIERHEALRAAMKPAEWRAARQAIEDYLRWPVVPPPPEVRALLDRAQPAVQLARRGAGAPLAPPDGDESEAILPQIRHLSALADLVAVDAMERLHAGDAAAAAERLADVFRIAEQAASAGRLAGTMGAFDVAGRADRIVRVMVDHGWLGPAECGVLMQRMARVDAHDPYWFLEATRSEGRQRVAVLAERAGRPGGLARVRAELDSEADDAASQAALAVMTDDSLDADFTAAERLLDRAVDAMVIADAERAQLELMRLDEANRGGEHGAVARAIFAPFAPAYERATAIADAIVARRMMLARIATGVAEPAGAANAATWYGRASQRYEEMAPRARERITRLAAEPASAVDGATESALDAAREAIALVERGSMLDRCDFWAERPDHPVGAAAYHAAMRDLVDLVVADAVRAVSERRFGDAAARIAVAFRVAAHLAADGALASSLLAQAAFERACDLLDPGLRADVFTAEQRMQLVRAARGVGYRDPFGYAAAASAERAAIGRWIGRRLGPLPVELALRVEAAMERCSDDQILMLALSAGRMEMEPADPVHWLVTALPPRDPRALERHATRMRELLDSGRLEDATALDDSAVPITARLSERRAAAHATVRDALVALRGAEVAATAE